MERDFSANTSTTTLPPALRGRQEALVDRARRLELRLGDPVEGLAALFEGLPPEDDAFWAEVQEVER
jgi:hypothetical protein